MTRRFFKVFSICLVLYSTQPISAYAGKSLSVEQAYQLIPHQRTVYNPKQSRMASVDAKYLKHYFFVVDLGTRARMMALGNFYGRTYGMSIDEYNKEILNLVSSFQLIQTPEHLKSAEKLLISALNDQRIFFNEWHNTKGTRVYDRLKKSYTNHAKVQSSHAKLYQAYMQILNQYPKEAKNNKQAFFDHLCALDFI